MTEAELREFLLDNFSLRDFSLRAVREGAAEREISERIQRANEKGTSHRICSHRDDLDGPWDTERCEMCGCFHHAFDPDDEGECEQCGELADDDAHTCDYVPASEPSSDLSSEPRKDNP